MAARTVLYVPEDPNSDWQSTTAQAPQNFQAHDSLVDTLSLLPEVIVPEPLLQSVCTSCILSYTLFT